MDHRADGDHVSRGRSARGLGHALDREVRGRVHGDEGTERVDRATHAPMGGVERRRQDEPGRQRFQPPQQTPEPARRGEYGVSAHQAEWVRRARRELDRVWVVRVRMRQYQPMVVLLVGHGLERAHDDRHGDGEARLGKDREIVAQRVLGKRGAEAGPLQRQVVAAGDQKQVVAAHGIGWHAQSGQSLDGRQCAAQGAEHVRGPARTRRTERIGGETRRGQAHETQEGVEQLHDGLQGRQ